MPSVCSILSRDSQFFQKIHNGLEEMSNIWSIYEFSVVWLLVDSPRSVSLRANLLTSDLEDSTRISWWQSQKRNSRISIDGVTRDRCVCVLLSCSTLLQRVSLKSVSKIPSSSSAVGIRPQGWVWLWKIDYEQGAVLNCWVPGLATFKATCWNDKEAGTWIPESLDGE